MKKVFAFLGCGGGLTALVLVVAVLILRPFGGGSDDGQPPIVRETSSATLPTATPTAPAMVVFRTPDPVTHLEATAQAMAGPIAQATVEAFLDEQEEVRMLEGAAAKATAMVEQAKVDAALASAQSTQEADEALLLLTQTAAEATISAPEATLVPSLILSPPSSSVLRFAVVDDNSGKDYRGLVSSALKEVFPDAEIVGFKGCDTSLAIEAWTLVVMDYQMKSSIDGPNCSRGILAVSNVPIIGYWPDEARGAFEEAGASAFVSKLQENSETSLAAIITELLQ